MRIDRTRLLAVRLILVIAMCAVAGPLAGTRGARVERILFIGNSLTYANDLPRMVQAVSRLGSEVKVSCDSVAFPNFSLEDHWTDGRAQERLVTGHWTLVVLQQGPSGGTEGRRVLREYSKKFAELARMKGARVALYAVWPSRARYRDMPAVIESHSLAAQDAGGTVVPVGQAWRAALEQDPSLPLYGKDGFHPSFAGTYLGALVFREWISGQPSAGVTATWKDARRLSLSPEQAALLERVAHEAVAAAGPAHARAPS